MFVLPLLVFLAVVDASPLSPSTGKGTLSLITRTYAQGIHDIVERDRARQPDASSIGAINTHLIYVANISTGYPPASHTVVVDTGSSNTWVGAIKPYVKTNTSHDTGRAFHVAYGKGNVTGREWIDTVTLSPNLVISRQSIGVANHSNGLANHSLDGILGLGPVNLTHNTVAGVDTVPTVMDNLYSQGTIPRKMFGIYFTPFCESNNTGELTFGGYDGSAIISPVVYTPLTTTPNASHFWGINQSVSYGTDTIAPSITGVVDTGTSLVYLSNAAFKIYQSKTGAIYDNKTHTYIITPDQYAKLEPLTFHVEGRPFVLAPNAQIFPRSLSNGTIHLAVGNLKDVYGARTPPADCILGYIFLERYYSVYDITEKRVGLAPTRYTNAECN